MRKRKLTPEEQEVLEKLYPDEQRFVIEANKLTNKIDKVCQKKSVAVIFNATFSFLENIYHLYSQHKELKEYFEECLKRLNDVVEEKEGK